MKEAIKIIVAREYFERVKRKSFIITTVLMPVLMLALMMAPAVIMYFSTGEKQTIAVVDDSGIIAKKLHNVDDIKFISATEDVAKLKSSEDFTAILVIGKDVVKNPDKNVTLYTHGSPSMITEGVVKNQIEKAIENERINSYEIANLAKIMKDVQVDLNIKTMRLDGDEETSTSSSMSWGLGLLMDFILYMFIMIYGQAVMNSIIEEKTNRVLEIVVASVNPTALMLGKILGIGAVAVTQMLIWAVLIGLGAIFLMPFVSSAVMASDDFGMIQALSQISDPSFVIQLGVFMLLFMIGGYLIYSSIYAAVGSAVDNIQDGAQLSSLATMPVLIAFLASNAVLTNPNSQIAIWTSMFPLTSPMVMMTRMPFDIPVWQAWVSLIILYASTLFMVWVAAKIYRVGIFMYGKKPTVMEMIRWARYK